MNCASRYNESMRLNERRLHFNVNALRDIIAESVHASSRHIIKFAKIAEGGSFRVFEATFRDNLKVIARLPYPCTLPHGEGIASEAATMEFLRLQGIPVPKVHAWDSSAANPVGAAYMIMEKVEGKELELSWYDMTVNERMDVMEKIVDVERKLFDIRFPAYGSLYFQGSLDPSIRTIPVTNVGERFCIGPSTEYLWWYQSRNELKVNHGPCTLSLKEFSLIELVSLKEHELFHVRYSEPQLANILQGNKPVRYCKQ